MREIVFDTETTGLSPGGDRMVEIGCIELVGRVETGKTFHCYFNPERAMPAEAEAVHGLSDTFLADKPLFGDKAFELIEFLGDAPLVAHNATFDFGFLNFELENAGHAPVSMDRMVDTLPMARAKHPGAKHSLDALCTRYGVDRSQRIKHGALLDAELLTQVYIELTGGRQIGLGIEIAEQVRTEMGSSIATTTDTPRSVRPARPHAPSEGELAAHRAFIEKMDDPLWSKVG